MLNTPSLSLSLLQKHSILAILLFSFGKPVKYETGGSTDSCFWGHIETWTIITYFQSQTGFFQTHLGGNSGRPSWESFHRKASIRLREWQHDYGHRNIMPKRTVPHRPLRIIVPQNMSWPHIHGCCPKISVVRVRFSEFPIRKNSMLPRFIDSTQLERVDSAKLYNWSNPSSSSWLQANGGLYNVLIVNCV